MVIKLKNVKQKPESIFYFTEFIFSCRKIGEGDVFTTALWWPNAAIVKFQCGKNIPFEKRNAEAVFQSNVQIKW